MIRDGMYVAGTHSKSKPSYTKGPSSWSHSHILTYPSGKRTIVFWSRFRREQARRRQRAYVKVVKRRGPYPFARAR